MRGVAMALAFLLLAGCSNPGDDDEGGDGPAAGLGPEAGILSGRLTATGTSNTQPMPIAAAGHERLAVVLVLVSNLPETELSMNVTGPAGRTAEVDTGPLLYVIPGTRPAVSFSSPEAGEWKVLVELEGGASADYEVHWCADAAGGPGPQDNLACQRDYT